jgi:hypothetical protein
MKPRMQLRALTLIALILLIVAGGLTTWITKPVLDPKRTVTIVASGSSTLAEPKAYFRGNYFTTQVGQPVMIPVWVDSNGGSLAKITAELKYNPADFTVSMGQSTGSICSAFTRRDQDPLAGRFTIECTAPTSTRSAVAPFVAFSVTPAHAGSLPLTLIGRYGDYAVVYAP